MERSLGPGTRRHPERCRIPAVGAASSTADAVPGTSLMERPSGATPSAEDPNEKAGKIARGLLLEAKGCKSASYGAYLPKCPK